MWRTLSIPWQAAFEEAWNAYRAGSLPIGSVIVGASGEIVARGRNRIGEAKGRIGVISGSRLAHAEVNALLAFDDTEHDPQTCTLYTTTEPCPLCVGAVRMTGIGRLVYASRDAWAGCAKMFNTVPYIRRRGVRVSSLAGSPLEVLLTTLQTDAHLRGVSPNTAQFLEVWRGVVPKGVDAGVRLYKSGQLQTLRHAAASPEEVLDVLAQSLRE